MSLQEVTTSAPEPAKPPRISKRLRKAIDLLASGKAKTQRDAADIVKMNECHLSRQLARPQIRRFMLDRATENIANGTLRASVRMLELIDAESEHVAAKVSDRILTNAGVLKAEPGSQVAVNVGVSVGYVIDTSRRRTVGPVTSHERSDEAKPLIEHASVSDREPGA